MKLTLSNREAIRRISPALEMELDQILGAISASFSQEHNADGSHTNIVVDSIVSRSAPTSGQQGATTPFTFNSGVNFQAGPITYDNPGNGDHVAGIRPPQLTANIDNYAPAGIDTARIIEIDASMAVNITGIKRAARQRRDLRLVNRSNFDITLMHLNAGSDAVNQFAFAGAVDYVLRSAGVKELYYEPGSEIWRADTG